MRAAQRRVPEFDSASANLCTRMFLAAMTAHAAAADVRIQSDVLPTRGQSCPASCSTGALEGWRSEWISCAGASPELPVRSSLQNVKLGTACLMMVCGSEWCESFEGAACLRQQWLCGGLRKGAGDLGLLSRIAHITWCQHCVGEGMSWQGGRMCWSAPSANKRGPFTAHASHLLHNAYSETWCGTMADSCASTLSASAWCAHGGCEFRGEKVKFAQRDPAEESDTTTYRCRCRSALALRSVWLVSCFCLHNSGARISDPVFSKSFHLKLSLQQARVVQSSQREQCLRISLLLSDTFCQKQGLQQALPGHLGPL